MPDREKVIKGLEYCLDWYALLCEKCPYQATEEEKKHVDWACHSDLRRDALELLKEQEAVEPIDLGLSTDFIVWGCPICERRLERDYKYCPFCGRAVKWG